MPETVRFVRLAGVKHAGGWGAVGLGAAAAVEAVIRADGSLPLVLLVAGATTVPVALVPPLGRALPGPRPVYLRAWPVAMAVTVAALVLSVFYRSPSVAGVVAVLLAWSPIVRHLLRRSRAETAARDAERRAVEATLLELTARGERARIARELHDLVAHHISMISVQADTARLAVPGMPPDGVRHLVAIGETARAALTEMRRLLGVLREDAEPAPTRRPQPGLRQLLDLIDETRTSGGSPARLIVSGPVVPLDPGIELTAYRIVQEALTNARRHAPGAAVDVELTYTPDLLCLRVRDNGPGPAAGAPGHGLLGMRERAATVGGTLHTGPAEPSGFLVEAALPTGAAS